MTERLPIRCRDCKTEFATHEAHDDHLREMGEALAPDSDDTSAEAELVRLHEDAETKRRKAAVKADPSRRWQP